jgi:hypothetical protein
VEPFNGRLRDYSLNIELFTTKQEARLLPEQHRIEYNTFMPHSALQGRTPLETLQQWRAARLPNSSQKIWTSTGGHISRLKRRYSVQAVGFASLLAWVAPANVYKLVRFPRRLVHRCCPPSFSCFPQSACKPFPLQRLDVAIKLDESPLVSVGDQLSLNRDGVSHEAAPLCFGVDALSQCWAFPC